MKKLSQVEAGNLISKAWQHVHKYSAAKYRFGQALFNILPSDIAKCIVSTDKDFFYKNDEETNELFYLHCVENENEE